MLVAAFNPVPNQSGTKVSVVLFGDGSQYAPSVMSTIDDRCEDIKSKLIELQYEFQVCDTNANKYEKKKGFESLCAKGSSAASGLKAIKEMIASSSSINSALVIMTDALLSELNDPEDRINAINALKDENLNLKTILASGITNPTQGSGATYANLVEYTRSDSQEFSDDHVVLGDSAIDVGRRVVKQMAESGIICADYGNQSKYGTCVATIQYRYNKLQYVLHLLKKTEANLYALFFIAQTFLLTIYFIVIKITLSDT